MTSRDFCYWLQGYFELEAADPPSGGLTPKQVETVKQHLSMVFIHEIDPSFPKEQKTALDEAHGVSPSGLLPSESKVLRC